jgi:hypothetical protein
MGGKGGYGARIINLISRAHRLVSCTRAHRIRIPCLSLGENHLKALDNEARGRLPLNANVRCDDILTDFLGAHVRAYQTI